MLRRPFILLSYNALHLGSDSAYERTSMVAQTLRPRDKKVSRFKQGRLVDSMGVLSGKEKIDVVANAARRDLGLKGRELKERIRHKEKSKTESLGTDNEQ